MSNIEILLEAFSDRELAYFYKYRSKQYTEETSKEIENIIFNKRGLSIRKIEKLTTEKISKHGKCQRCGSLREILYDVEFYPIEIKRMAHYDFEDFTSHIIKKEQSECLICGYIIKNPNKLELFKNIFNFFRKR